MSEKIPRHVAIIMDGNGRWARARDQPRVKGHEQGAEAVNRVTRACRARGVEVLTLYAFSEQNWRRPADEVTALMRLLLRYVRGQRREILDNNIRLTVLGDIDKLPLFVRAPLKALMKESAHNDGMILALALSYGGREELLRAVRAVAARAQRGELRAADIMEADFEAELFTAGWPDPDLLIRTSGEARISNFLLWQIAYTELYFTPIAWPDFDEAELDRAFEHYQGRQRRFGMTGAQIEAEGLIKAEETTL
ncbi:isoprenyl transferase [Myxococcota bacterium]|nr:isoprenyl transferase [Myxococcota bacterium]MBU1431207.1 isoprenyl transferase [Myxococcota bacterium]MBU1896802.1 isoprenyl transferase [Myxococcota bacterium]